MPGRAVLILVSPCPAWSGAGGIVCRTQRVALGGHDESTAAVASCVHAPMHAVQLCSMYANICGPGVVHFACAYGETPGHARYVLQGALAAIAG